MKTKIVFVLLLACITACSNLSRKPQGNEVGNRDGDHPANSPLSSAQQFVENAKGLQFKRSWETLETTGHKIFATRPVLKINSGIRELQPGLEYSQPAEDGTCFVKTQENIHDRYQYKVEMLESGPTLAPAHECAAIALNTYLAQNFSNDLYKTSNEVISRKKHSSKDVSYILSKQTGCVGRYSSSDKVFFTISLDLNGVEQFRFDFLPTEEKCISLATTEEDKALIREAFAKYGIK